MRFISIVGARPQFVKVAMVSKALRELHEGYIIHTGQHYDDMMSATFFKELQIPKPDYHLECGSGTHGVQTARMLEGIEHILLRDRFDWVIVYGDTNSTLAAALVAAKLHIPIAHVEAGLRSYNRRMPEEINRIVTDHLSERLFCPTETACEQLRCEGITKGVEHVGDVMYDALLQVQPLLEEHAVPLLRSLQVQPQAYVLATVHRAANTDDPEAMISISKALNELDMPVIFPVHPRTRKCLESYKIVFKKHVQVIDPLGYLDMLALEQSASCILTDSGGVQKEAFLLEVPCITLREETEWIETVQAGWNILAGTDWQTILSALAKPRPLPVEHNPFGQGDAAQRIAQNWPME